MPSSYNDMTRIIYERVLPEMEANSIPDTTENRISFLQGLRDAWRESGDEGALPWINTINHEMIRLSVARIAEMKFD